MSNSDIQRDMEWSTLLFQNEVWPIIKKIVGGGDLMIMEGRPDQELASKLDMLSGIDGWHICNGMRGIASRVQKGDRSWNSFTIRMSRDSGASTEYEKRKAAINDNTGWIYPHLTVQAYAKTESGPILSVGVAKTIDIIDYITHGHHELRQTTNAKFAVCFWENMRDQEYRVWQYSNQVSIL